MPTYSQRSKDKLASCHKDLQEIFTYVIIGFDNTILCGNRNKEDQDEAFRKGLSKVEYPNSKHNSNPSMAVDAVPYPIDWEDTNRMRYFAGYVQGIALMLYQNHQIDHLVRWGGDWNKDTELKDNRFQDLPHFELYKP